MADNHEHLSIESTRSPAPTSTILQDLLREKKAQSHRVNKTYNVDSREPRRRFSEFDTREVQSSPLAASNAPKAQAKHNRRVSGMGTRNSSGTKEMGAREMDEVTHRYPLHLPALRSLSLVCLQDQQAKLRSQARVIPTSTTCRNPRSQAGEARDSGNRKPRAAEHQRGAVTRTRKTGPGSP